MLCLNWHQIDQRFTILTTQGQVERFNKSLKHLLKKEIQVELSQDNKAAVKTGPMKYYLK